MQTSKVTPLHMRSVLKHLVVTVVCCAIIAAIPANALALDTTKYNSYAKALSTLGVFVGTGNGYELDRKSNRLEGVVMFIRLVGAEKEALAMAKEKNQFTDVPAWGVGYVNYAYKNNLTKGVTTTNFGSSWLLTSEMYLTFILRSLGYQEGENGHFLYSKTLDFAESIGLLDSITAAEIKSNGLLRGHMAKISYNALLQPVRGSSSTTLLDKLVAQGKFTQTQAKNFKASNLGMTSTADQVTKNLNATVQITATRGKTTIAQGSGVIIKSDGTIVTGAHLLKNATNLTIKFNDGTVYTGSITVQDFQGTLDLAVIKINKSGLTAVKIGSSTTVKQGDKLVAMGSVLGVSATASNGNALAVGQDQIRVALGASSGSGLYNNKGELVGVITTGQTEAKLAFAVPADKLKNLAAKKQLTLAQFNAQIGASILDSPSNIKVIKDQNGVVHITWDKVTAAQHYFVYDLSKASAPRLANAAGAEKFTIGEDYNLRLSGLKDGDKITLAISSGVLAGESRKYTYFTYKIGDLGQSQDLAKTLAYYSSAGWLPDFGKAYGIEQAFSNTVNKLTTITYYLDTNEEKAAPDKYIKLVENLYDFTASASQAQKLVDSGLSNNPKAFTHTNGKTIWMYKVTATDSKEKSRFVVMYEN